MSLLLPFRPRGFLCICMFCNAGCKDPDQMLHSAPPDFGHYRLMWMAGCVEGVVYLTSPCAQLILAYSWASSAILVACKDRGGDVSISFVSSLSFLFLFFPCPSHASPLLSLLSLLSLSLGDDTKWPTRTDVSLNPNTINQSINYHRLQIAHSWNTGSRWIYYR